MTQFLTMDLDETFSEDMRSPFAMKPSPGSSGTSLSSKTPGTDLEERRSLDTVSDYGS